MQSVLWVGLGGFLGSIARYLIGLSAQKLPSGSAFPWGTVVVNVLGCLAIGILAGMIEARPQVLSHETRAFLFVGVLGGFTTFSAFGLESMQLLRAPSPGLGMLNVGMQVGVGLVAVWVGLLWGRSWMG